MNHSRILSVLYWYYPAIAPNAIVKFDNANLMKTEPKQLRVCIIASFITGFGKTGGFGNMTKQLALSLQERNCEVTVVVPRRPAQAKLSYLGGIRIIGLDLLQLFSLATYKTIDADIYHSQNPNFLSFIAMLAQPRKKHVVTYRDPRDVADLLTELRVASWKGRLKSPLVFQFENGPFVSYTVKNADLVGCPAYYLVEKMRKKYGRSDAILLPNIERFPARQLQKNKKPTVCFVGRLDPIKRPEIVFDLAEKFRHVEFMIAGVAQDSERQKILMAQALEHPNIKMLGYIDKFSSNQLSALYEKSWILLNASPREGLPMTFIEAAGHGCAILSRVNPDDFAAKFGYWVRDDDFAKGLTSLLADNRWQAKGKLGQEYVRDTYDETKAINAHLQAYRNLLGKQDNSKD